MQSLSCPDCPERFTNKAAFHSHNLSHGNVQSTSTVGQSSQQSNEEKKEKKIKLCNEDNHESDDQNDNAADADSGS